MASAKTTAPSALTDPTFRRSVVLVAQHDDEGAVGVVLTSPGETPVADILEKWAPLTGDPPVAFFGGPVALDSVLALAVVPRGRPEGWRRVRGSVGIVDLDAPPAVLADAVRGVRVFVGYAGWGAGQLEEELAEGAWYVVDAEPGDVLTDRPRALWRSVLRRQGGNLGMLATYPDDASLN
ncbi:YqgE/AlgH family protein [Streptomyces bohaiensis]|uniref:YqgE/AlgH family protein n=1 Tax=Streptomyces bohaiensis TaxID=1431344 RepID=A0ABX1CIT5_9ACTN|nr:YqgE/AlgH family protein [Streptomyces bohaiensis]NJQ17815.1 YqgE/AlgH family protein [Streptomyces bohaiensis]